MGILEKVLCRERLTDIRETFRMEKTSRISLRITAALAVQLMEKSNGPLCYRADMFRQKGPGTKSFLILQAE